MCPAAHTHTMWYRYACPHMHAKLFAGFDEVWLGILEADPVHARLLFFSEANQTQARFVPRLQKLAGERWCALQANTTGGATRLHDPPPPPASLAHARVIVDTLLGVHSRAAGGDCFQRAATAVAQRVSSLSTMDLRAFVDMLAAVDVVLDPWPFGGGMLTHEAVVLAGTPVVTLPSGTRSGRLSRAILRRLGLDAEVRCGVPCLCTVRTLRSVDCDACAA